MKVTTRAIVPLNDPPLRTLPMRSGLWLNIVKSPRLSRRYFSPTASSHSKQPESQNASVSSSVKEEQDDEDPPFALLSRRSLRLLKIVVTTAAGIACVFADYSEITEEHIFSGVSREVHGT